MFLDPTRFAPWGHRVLRKLPDRAASWSYVPPLIFVAATLVLTLPVLLDHEAPNYVDQMGHLLRLWFLTESVGQGSVAPGWMPVWYSGTDFIRYYPPLTTYLMLPFNLVIRDPTDTYFTFGALLIFGACITMYLLAREFTGRIGATAAALLFAFSQLFLLAYWYEGNLGRATAAFLAPLAFMFGYRVLRLASARSFVALALSTGGLILAHSMQGLMFLMLLGLFLLGASLVSEKRLAGLVRVGASVALGAGLSLFWFLPSISHFDLANVPKLFTEKIYIYSVGLDIFDTWNFREDVFGVAYFGVPVAAAVYDWRLGKLSTRPAGPTHRARPGNGGGLSVELGNKPGILVR